MIFPMSRTFPPPSICEMAKDVSDGTKTITIPLMTPEIVSGSIILKNIVTLFAPRSRAASIQSFLILVMELYIGSSMNGRKS